MVGDDRIGSVSLVIQEFRCQNIMEAIDDEVIGKVDIKS